MDNYKEILLSEAYYSKTPLLQDCEKMLDISKKKTNNGFKNPNNTDEFKKIESNLAKQFGFEKVSLKVVVEERFMNAFTVPFFNEKTYSKKDLKLVKDNNGIRFAKPDGKFLYVYLTSFLFGEYDSNTIMAIIIHEVGHNFFLVDEQIVDTKIRFAMEHMVNELDRWNPNSKTIYGNMEVLENLMDIASYLNSPQQYIDKAYKNSTQDREFENVESIRFNLRGKLTKFINTAKGILFFIPNLAADTLVKLIYAMFTPAILARGREEFKYDTKNYQSYAAEKFSDGFAIAHGYGSDTAELWRTLKLDKLHSNDYLLSIPVIRIFKYYNSCFYISLFTFFDPHPATVKRYEFAVKKLEFELANSNDLLPEQEKEIRENLKKIKRINFKTPIFKKMLDFLTKRRHNEKDKMSATVGGIDDKKIFDFDNDLLKEYMLKGD